MALDHQLGVTVVSAGGRTTVPERVIVLLKLEPTLREKILWTQDGDKVVVSKGTPQSSFRKTRLSGDGKAAIPKHIQNFLRLKSTIKKEDRVVWMKKENAVVVRKGTPPVDSHHRLGRINPTSASTHAL